MMTVGEFCSRDVVVMRGDETVVDAARVMREHHVGSVVWVEERDQVVYPRGMLTDRDLVVGVLANDAGPYRNLLLRDVAAPKLITTREEESLSDALSRMRAHGVRRLPVVDGRGALVGIVAFDDLIEQVAETMGELAELLKRERSAERRRRH